MPHAGTAVRMSNMVTNIKTNTDASDLSTQDGTKDPSDIPKRQDKKRSNSGKDKNGRHRDLFKKIEVQMGRPCCKDGSTEMDVAAHDVGPQNRKEERGTTEHTLGRYIQAHNRSDMVKDGKRP